MANEPKLIRVQRLDSVPLNKVEYTPEGYLIDAPIVTSVGIFDYYNPDGSVRKELRLPEYVFDERSLATYEGKPVIITHEAGRVSKNNVTDEIVGTILSKGYQDGDDVRAKIIIHDTDTVKQTGMRELSLGYDLVLDETPGEWNGKPYDAIQTEIAINHLAIVREARAGEQARLNIDSKQNNQLKGANAMKNKTTKAMNADEMKKSIADYDARRKRRLDEAEQAAANADDDSNVAEEVKENSDNPPTDTPPSDNPSDDSPSIDKRVQLVKDRRDRRDADGDPGDTQTSKAVIAGQDEDIEQLLKIIDELKAKGDMSTVTSSNSDDDDGDGDGDGGCGNAAQPMNADSVDAIVAERLNLGRLGDRLNLDGLETLKPIEAKKRVIKAIKPDLRLDGKTAHYINTAFDIAVQELNSRKDTIYQRKQMFNGDSRGGSASQEVSKSQKARDEMIERAKNGGKK